jgi:agmatinase
MNDSVFDLGTPPEEAGVRILGVPFEGTVSYRKGTALAPRAILAASCQVELLDLEQESWPGGDGEPWKEGIHLEIAGDGHDGGEVNRIVREWTQERLDEGRLPVILGGEHSVPFGAIEAAAAHHPELGIVHFDAHADLRVAYQGHRWSHASILHNILEEVPEVESVLSIGLRDLCEEELSAIRSSCGRVHAIFDHLWATWRLEHADLRARIREAIALLPEQVWITFDIDCLDPSLCPNTGTPVPGGLRWDEINLWLGELAASDKKIVGFDLCEVSPGENADPEVDSWDAIVGARLLYRLIGCAVADTRK